MTLAIPSPSGRRTRKNSMYSGSHLGQRSNSKDSTKTVVSITDALLNSELELYPLKGEFINYDVDTTYVMSFTVRNRSVTTQTLRFFPPQKASNAFRLVNHDAVRLAPGLERVVDVEFSTHTVNDYQDTFVILTERGAKVEVPLIAQSAPAMELDPVVDFGVVEHNRTSLSLPFNLKNRGRREALVTLTVPPEAGTSLVIKPSVILAKPLRDTKVSVELSGLAIGKFEWPVEVLIEGEAKTRLLSVRVEVVDCRSRLLDLQTGEEAVSVTFSKVYAGAKEAHDLLMINGSEVGVSFAFQLTNELVAKEAPPFRFIPEQGTLGPKEKRRVSVVFEPPMNYVRKGWNNPVTAANRRSGSSGSEAKKFEGLFSLLFVETEETHSFHVVGESTETQVSISRTVLNFGQCAMGDYRNEIIEIRNDVEALPMSFAFDRLAHLRVDPAAGVVPAGAAVEVVVTFQPHKPGSFSEKLKLILNKSVRRAITVVGQAVVDAKHKRVLVGGIDKLSEDFKQPLKLPDKPRAVDPLRYYYDDTEEIVKPPTAAESGTAVDIGMIPAEGIYVPKPPHRIEQKELREEDEAIHSPSAHVAPMNFDVKSLIRRRFNEAPENAVERRDCRRELLPMDLLKVVAPIKTLQFERITIGTCASRPYYLYNGTNAAILVTMPPEEMYQDLKFTPRSQVIPPSRMAAFDISLCSTKIQSCQQVINFTVNHQYPMRLSFHADIVPVEVSLSFYEVTLNFSDFTDEPVTRTTVTLTNNGNCDASFWWKLPPKAAFTIEPAEGTMSPMSKLSAEITFTPPQGVLSFTCDAYLAVEGASEDKRLQLTGLVEQTNCSWAKVLVKATGEAQIDLRRIPAGKAAPTNIYISNNGKSHAFYSFDSLAPWMSITPVCGRISAGETEDLLLSVKMDKVENISQMISCHIRGMRKPLRMHLTANVVAPALTVTKATSNTASTGSNAEIVLNYGDAYIGYSKKLSVKVKNGGDVPGVILIDLSDFHRDIRLTWKNAPTAPRRTTALNAEDWDPMSCGASGSVGFPELEDGDDLNGTDGGEGATGVSGSLSARGRGGSKNAVSLPATARSSPLTVPGGSSLRPGQYLVTIEPGFEELLDFWYRPSADVMVSSAASSSALTSPTASSPAWSRTHRYQVQWKQLGADDVLHVLPPLVLTGVPIPAKVEVPKRVFRFPSMVVSQTPQQQLLTIKNLCLEATRWGIRPAPDAPDSDTEQFLVGIQEGTLPPNGTVQVPISFMGSETGNFRGVFNVYVDEAPHKPCKTITLYAKATKPRLVPDKKRIILPPVPLGVMISDVIHVTNDGFDSIQLQYTGETQSMVSVVFPRGEMLSTQVRRIPVEIVFSSMKPVCVQSSLIINSNKGESFEVHLCATAINSILTTAPFVQYREHFSTIAPADTLRSLRVGSKEGYTNAVSCLLPTPYLYKEQKNNNVVTINTHEKNSTASRYPQTAPYEMMDVLNRSAFNRGSLDVLTRWFNIVLLRSPVENIIDAMQQSHGGILYDIITRLFGKRPTPISLKTMTVNSGESNSSKPFDNIHANPGETSKPPDFKNATLKSNAKPGDALRSAAGKSGVVKLAEPVHSSDLAANTANNSLKGNSVTLHHTKGEQMIQNLFNFMEFYGCCIQHLQAKYLLLYEEYLEVIPKTEQPLNREAFQERLWQSWVSVLLETVRVFMFSKLTLSYLIQQSKPFNNQYLPVELWESNSSMFREVLSGSNVYSTTESLLLFWVRTCIEKYCSDNTSFASSQKIRVTSFADLKDTRSLVSVVLVYCPAFHPFFFSGEKQVVLNPTSAADHDNNASILLSALTELAIPHLPSSRVFLEFSQMHMALFTSILMSYLPKFMSQVVVHFEGKLLSPITRTVRIRNPSDKNRLYRVWIENSLFVPSKRELVVPRDSVVALDIVFMPRYNRVVRGRCVLIDQSPVPLEDHIPYVFNLHAAPNMEPTKIFEIQTNLYEPLAQDIMVENPFEQDCVVSVRISQEGSNPSSGGSPIVPLVPRLGFGDAEGKKEDEVSPKNESKASTNGQKSDSLRNSAASDKPGEGHFLTHFSNAAFFVYTDVLPLRKGENAKLPIHFIPLCRGLYVLKITFRDEREGEFSYVVKGTCKDPKPNDTIDFRTELDEPCTVGLTVRATNNPVERTVRLFEEKCRQIHREIPPLTLEWANNVYNVEFLNDKLEGPNPFFAPANEGATSIKIEGSSSVYHFLFNPKFAGSYPGMIRLTSPIDVRIIRMNGECVPRGQRLLLRFHCPARQIITQDITINNLSDQDWLITATLEGDCFSGAKELRVPKGKRKDYSVKYSPHWITDGKEDTGLLTLLNSGTGQKHTYTLVGEADAPLSEDILHIQCRAREHHSLVLTVPNVARHDCTYYIETDLPFTEGEMSIIIPRDSFARYTLNFFPAVGGSYVGKVIFKSHQGLYVWFIVNVVVTPPEKEGTVVMQTDVRTSVVADITMRNPMNKPMSFFVRRFGAGLYGENILTIEPQSAAIHNCIFVPTHAGEMEGRLSFCNDEVGEFWYELKMIVEESTPEELKFTSPLGVPSSARVKLTNTTDQECTLQVINSNPRNFTISPSTLVIPANRDLLVDVTYLPTSVGEPQEGSLVISHHQLGQWQYSLMGTGIEPDKNKLTTCVCEMGSNTALSLPFTNSLDVPTRMLFSFTENEGRNFSIRRAPEALVAPGASGVVVVVYAPHAVGQHKTTLEIRPEVGLTRPEYNVSWTFPIEANAEWRETTTPFRFRCAARKNHEETITLPAPGLTPADKECATIRFVPDPNQHYLAAVHASFVCNLVQEDPMPDAFKATIRFTPLRSMAASGDLLVRGANGGSWRYRVYLEASPAPLDDTIQMKSAYKTTSSVSFDLYNVFSYKSKFAAYLTSESSRDFTVVPTHGVLLPFTRGQKSTAAATTLRINFTPTTRVPQVEGVLVVDTEDMQWSFKVVGRLDNEKGSNRKP